MANGGTTMDTPACGIAIVPPRRPFFFETVVAWARAGSRCTGLMVAGEPRRPVRRLALAASAGAAFMAEAAGVDGAVLSVAPHAARVTETATIETTAARERTRMEKVLKG